MRTRRILTIAGTRPEAIKLAPLVRILSNWPGLEHRLVATGQHRSLFHHALAHFDLEVDDDLALPNRSVDQFADQLGAVLPAIFRAEAPDLVIVQGDTTSAWATALSAHALGIPVAHVEAGLRSPDPGQPWPEESNRREIDAVSTLLFAPSEAAADNLVGLAGEIHVTGNTGIDALLYTRDALPLTLHERGERRLVLVTCHRREAIPRLAELATALAKLGARGDIDILMPVHPNPAISAPLHALLGGHPNIQLTPPLDYPELVRMMDAAHLLLTDSGGLQEEAPALGLPALILRDVTERPEPIASGNARVVGLNPAAIVREATRLLDDPVAHARMARPSFPYGRGDAAPRIAAAIASWLGLPPITLYESAVPALYR